MSNINIRVAHEQFVWWFATRPTYDGQGYGSQLLKYVEETFYAIL